MFLSNYVFLFLRSTWGEGESELLIEEKSLKNLLEMFIYI